MEKIVDLAHLIKDAAGQGLIVRAEVDSVGITLNFEGVFRPVAWQHTLTWEALVSSHLSLLGRAVNDAIRHVKVGLDPTGAPHYTYATGGVVEVNSLPLFGERPSETVVTLDEWRKLKGAGP